MTYETTTIAHPPADPNRNVGRHDGSHDRCDAAEKRQAEPDPVFVVAYDSIRKGAPGLSDRTCEAIARSIAIKVAYAAKTSGEPGQ